MLLFFTEVIHKPSNVLPASLPVSLLSLLFPVLGLGEAQLFNQWVLCFSFLFTHQSLFLSKYGLWKYKLLALIPQAKFLIVTTKLTFKGLSNCCIGQSLAVTLMRSVFDPCRLDLEQYF